MPRRRSPTRCSGLPRADDRYATVTPRSSEEVLYDRKQRHHIATRSIGEAATGLAICAILALGTFADRPTRVPIIITITAGIIVLRQLSMARTTAEGTTAMAIMVARPTIMPPGSLRPQHRHNLTVHRHRHSLNTTPPEMARPAAMPAIRRELRYLPARRAHGGADVGRGRVPQPTADKAYNTNRLRPLLADKATEPVIPSIMRRKGKKQSRWIGAIWWRSPPSSWRR